MAFVPKGFNWEWNGTDPCAAHVSHDKGLPGARVICPGLVPIEFGLDLSGSPSIKDLTCREIEGGHEFDLPASVLGKTSRMRWTDTPAGLKLAITFEGRPTVPMLRTPVSAPPGTKFFHQPELTQKQKDEGAERPEEVVDTFAVYGYVPDRAKIGHVGRLFLENAKKERVWVKQRWAGNAFLIDLDLAWPGWQYPPVVLDPTYLGKSSVGLSAVHLGADKVTAVGPYTAVSSGTADTIEVYGYGYTVDPDPSVVTLGYWVDDTSYPAARAGDGEGISMTYGAGNVGWWPDTCDSGGTITSGTAYWVGLHCDDTNYPKFYYDNTDIQEYSKADAAYTGGVVPDPFPASAGAWDGELTFRVGYTAAAGGVPKHMRYLQNMHRG